MQRKLLSHSLSSVDPNGISRVIGHFLQRWRRCIPSRSLPFFLLPFPSLSPPPPPFFFLHNNKKMYFYPLSSSFRFAGELPVTFWTHTHTHIFFFFFYTHPPPLPYTHMTTSSFLFFSPCIEFRSDKVEENDVHLKIVNWET